MDVWQTTQTIVFNNVDLSGRITPFAVFDYFQDAAELHAEHLGCGRAMMLANKQVWVLSRMSVLIEKRAQFNDTVTVRSWPRGFDRLFCVRDYDMADAQGNIIVRARSGWLIVDWDKRRPVRPQTLAVPLPPNDGRNAMEGSPLGLDKHATLAKSGERMAAYSDMDFNGHMNNARYVQWIQDIASGEKLRDAEKMRIDINYLSEIHLNEMVELHTAQIDDAESLLPGAGYALSIAGHKQNVGEVAFRAELRLS